MWCSRRKTLLLVLAASLLACTAGAANGDEVVSNLDQADGGSTSLKQFDQAQAFTTGSNSNGYTLTSVEIDFDMSRLGVWGADSVLTVGIWTDGSGSPGSSLGSLTSSTSGLSSGIHEFTTSGIDLDANTQYFIVVDVTDPNSCVYATANPVTCRQRIANADHVQDTASDAEDSGAASGWSIHDQSLSRAWDATGGWTAAQESRKIRIGATARLTPIGPPPAPQVSHMYIHDNQLSVRGLLKFGISVPSPVIGSVVSSLKVQWKSGSQDFDSSRQAVVTLIPASVSGSHSYAFVKYEIMGLTNGVEYTVRIVATNEHGDGPPSNAMTATPNAKPEELRQFIEADIVEEHESSFPWLRETWNYMQSNDVLLHVPTDSGNPGIGVYCNYEQKLADCFATWMSVPIGVLDGDEASRKRTILLYLAGIYTQANGVSANPAPLAMAHLYFNSLGSSCTPRWMYADILASVVLGGSTTGASYWNGCGVGSHTSAALAVVRSAVSGQEPSWFSSTYDDADGDPDLERVWANLISLYKDDARAVAYQLRNQFGGYCDEESAADAITWLTGAREETRNPWADGGCVPGAPISLTAVPAGDERVAVSWEAPASDGGSFLHGYKVEWKSGSEEYDQSRRKSVRFHYRDSARPSHVSETIGGLTNGVEYAIRVVAYNRNGDGAEAEVTATPSATDAVAPELLAATVERALLELTYNEALDEASAPASGAFAVSVAGAARSVDDVSVEGSTVTLTLSSVVAPGEAVTVSYTVPTDVDAPRIQDPTGNDAAAITAKAVTNDTPPVSSDASLDALSLAYGFQPCAHDSALQCAIHGGVDPDFGQWEVGASIDLIAFRAHATHAHATVEYGPPADAGSKAEGYPYEVALSEGDTVITITVTAEDGVTTRTYEITVTRSDNSPAAGSVAISGTVRVGETLTASLFGVLDLNGLSNATFSYQWVSSDGTTATDIQGATGSSYALAAADAGKTVTVRVSFTDDEGHTETLTSAATAAVEPATAEEPLTATFDAVPSAHDGSTAFSFTLRFSEEVAVSDVAMRDEVLDVSGGAVTNAQRSDPFSTRGWGITAAPDGAGNVFVVLHTGRACDESGAVCTGDGKRLLSALAVSIAAPSSVNSPATGLPVISGTAEVGETLTAAVAGIEDADGLGGATFAYQWISNDVTADTETDIQGATAASYTLVAADAGKSIKVRVSFTDGGGYDESVTSEPTAAVADNSPAWDPNFSWGYTMLYPGLWDIGAEDQERWAGFWPIEGPQFEPAGLAAGEKVNFRVEAYAAHGIESVRLELTGAHTASRTDNTAPYTLFDDPAGLALPAGSYQISATAYPEAGLGGTPGTTRTATFALATDTTAPAVRVLCGDDVPTSRSFEVTVVFNEWVLGFALSDVAVADASGAQLAHSGSGHGPVNASLTHYSVNLQTDVSGEITVTVPAGVARDEVGNLNTASEPLRIALNRALSVADASAVEGTDETIEFEVTLDAASDCQAATVDWATAGGTATAPADYTAATGTLTFSGGETTQTIVVVVADDGVTESPEDFQVTLSNPTNATIADAVGTGQITDAAGITNTPATGQPTITGTAQVGQTLTAVTSGIADANGLGAFSYQWIAHDGSDRDIPGATGASYVPVATDIGKSIKVRVSFTDGGGTLETLTSAATALVVVPLTASFVAIPATPPLPAIPPAHDGATAFRLRILFSEEIGISHVTFRDESLEVTGATVTRARRVDRRSDLWEITVAPDSDAEVVVVLPADRACNQAGAICDRAGTGKRLSNRLEATIAGPAAAVNTAPTGLPEISGTLQVGATLTASTADIEDADGLGSATFSYQWIASDGTTDTDIQGATAASYTLVAADAGKSIEVRVSFTDGGGTLETLTSAATATVAVVPVTVVFGAAGYTAAEGGAAAQVAVLLSAAPLRQLTIALTATPAGGADAGDYEVVDSVSFAGGETAQTITVSATDDSVDDDHESVVLGFGPLPAAVSAGSQPTTTVSIADDDAAPVIVTSSPLEVPENRTAVAVLEATDADGPVADLAWEIAGGADAGKFTLTADGVLAFTAAQDYEAPGDADADGEYEVTVRVTDGYNPVTAALTVRLLDVDEVAPTLASAAVDAAVLVLTWDETLDASSVPVAGAFAVTVGSAPRGVAGVAVAGSTVTLTLAAAVTAADTVTVSYTVPADAAAARIEDVAGNAAAGFSGRAVSNDTPAAVNTPPTGLPVISGTPQVGATLTASTAGIEDADGLGSATFSYQWISSDGTTDTDIQGATAASYTLVAGDAGKSIKVRVSFTDGGGTLETLTSAATAPVAAELPAVSIAAQTSSVVEGTAAVFTLTRSGAATAPLTVKVALTETGSVLDGTPAETAAFVAAATATTLAVATRDDLVVEAAGRIEAAVTAGDDYAVAAAAAAAGVEVTDNDTAVFSLGLEPVEIAEGETATLTVAIAGGVSFAEDQEITLDFDGSATEEIDFTVSAATLTLVAGRGSVTATISALEDGAGEAAETVTITAVHGATGVSTHLTIAASAADQPEVAIRAATVYAGEGSDAVFTLTRTAGIADALTVAVAVEESGTMLGAAVPASAEFAPGAREARLTVPTADDGTDEADSAVTARVVAGTGYRIAASAASATVTVLDDDGVPTAPAGVLWSADMAVVDFGTGGLGAGSPGQFSNIAGSGNFYAKWLWYYVPDRTLYLALSADLGDGEASTLHLEDVVVAFPEAGGASFTWDEVDLDWTDGQTVAVRIAQAAEGTPSQDASLSSLALAGAAFDPLFDPEVLLYAVAVDSATASVTVSAAATTSGATIGFEPAADADGGTAGHQVALPVGESLIAITVTAADGATQREYRVVATRARPPAGVSFGAAAYTATEGGAPAAVAVLLSADPEREVTIPVTATAAGGADAGDYTVAGSVTFAARGPRSQTITVTAVEDDLEEVGERVVLGFGVLPQGIVASGTTTATVALADAVVGPDPVNSPATGLPVISGTAEVGETLTAAVAGIEDADGLTGVTFAYQWISNDVTTDTETDIQGATAASYTLAAADAGKSIKVRVSFTDGGGYDESVTSEPTAAVADNSPAWDPNFSWGYTMLYPGLWDIGAEDQERWAGFWPIRGPQFEPAGLAAGEKVNFRVEAYAAHGIGSVRLELTGAHTASRTDNTAPYTLFDDPAGLALPAGSYQISATAYPEAGLGGTPGTTRTATFALATDTTAPAVRVLCGDDVPTSRSFEVTVVFNEWVLGFALSDVAVADASGAQLAHSGSGHGPVNASLTHYSVNLQTDVSGEITVTVPAGVAGDEVGNLNTASEPLRIALNRALSVADASAVEGTDETIEFEVTLDAASDCQAATVDWATAGGTATAPADYTAATGTLTFGGGETTQTIVVVVADDGVAESPEDFQVTLSNPTNATLAGAVGTGQITDDDSAPVIVTSSPLEVPENRTAVAVLEATDAADPVADLASEIAGRVADLAWEIAGGADAGKFTLTADGVLAFTTAQDYEAPGDADTDGDYEVTVRVTDGHNPVATALTVRLLDVDEVAPTLASAAVDGAVLALTWDETLDESSVPAAGAFAVTVASAPRGVAGVAVAASAVTLTLAAPVVAADTVTVSYTVPADAAAVRIEDAAGNAAAGFSGRAVSNDTPAAVNTPPTGLPVISGTPQVGATLTASTAGIEDADGLGGATFAYQWLASDGTTESDIQGATAASYTLVAADAGTSIKVRVTFTDGGGTLETLVSAATAAVAVPLTASFEKVPESHDGSTAFTFELRFSEEPAISYRTLRDAALEVTGGTVTRARRLAKPSNMHWQLRIRPTTDGDVTVVLPADRACDESGAICTDDGRELSNRLELTVAGPASANRAPTGLPANIRHGTRGRDADGVGRRD